MTPIRLPQLKHWSADQDFLKLQSYNESHEKYLASPRSCLSRASDAEKLLLVCNVVLHTLYPVVYKGIFLACIIELQ